MNNPEMQALKNLFKKFLIWQYTHCKLQNINTYGYDCSNCPARKLSSSRCLPNDMLYSIDLNAYRKIETMTEEQLKEKISQYNNINL